jgi:hypothetical protein
MPALPQPVTPLSSTIVCQLSDLLGVTESVNLAISFQTTRVMAELPKELKFFPLLTFEL